MNGDRSDQRAHVFGDYYLLTTLASGGMGTVHLAKRVGFRADIQRFFAVKKLPRGHANARELRRFHDEARVVVTLNHRALCNVFDVGVVDDEHYLAMELVEGVTLERALDATKLEPKLALYVIDEMLDALDYVHDHRDPATGEPMQIVHRDVSPQNVMLSFQGGVKLIDFGLVSSTLKQEKTVGGVVVGKLEYMSPEQARGESLDARSDVYAAAIIAFEMLSGRRFYEGLSKGALSTAVVEGNHAPSFEGIDARLVPILRRALAAERNERTASCAVMQSELATFARASSRDLRDALQRALPEEKAHLEELIKSFRDVGTEKEVATSVRHIARSSSDPDWSDEPTFITASRVDPSAETRARDDELDTVKLPQPPPRAISSSPERSRPVPLTAFTTVAVVAAVVVLGIILRVAHDDDRDHAPRPVSPAQRAEASAPPPVSSPVASPASSPGALAGADAGVDESAAAVVAELHDDDSGGERERPSSSGAAVAHKPAKHVRPPNTSLPDLAANLDYLAQWCARLSCAKPVLASRGRIPLLDVVGLRTLRREAEACVVECRR